MEPHGVFNDYTFEDLGKVARILKSFLSRPSNFPSESELNKEADFATQACL